MLVWYGGFEIQQHGLLSSCRVTAWDLQNLTNLLIGGAAVRLHACVDRGAVLRINIAFSSSRAFEQGVLRDPWPIAASAVATYVDMLLGWHNLVHSLSSS